MAKSAILAVRIVGDAADAIGAFNQSKDAASAFQSALDSASLVAGAAITGLVGFGTVAVNAASDAEQAMGGVQSIFGDTADQILAFADDAAQAVGLSTTQYNELATVFGAQLRNMGLESDALIGTTDDLIGMGADLAATFGGTTADAVGAISALLRGERDPIERYGVALKQADIDARMAADGLDHLEGEARRQAETMTTLTLLSEQTAGAQGQFAREADTAAGQVQRMQAELANTTAELGEQLLPLLAGGAQLLSEFAQWVSENQELVTGLAIAVGVIAAAIIALNVAMRAYAIAQGVAAAATKLWSAATKSASITSKIAAAAQWLWNAAVAASPVVLIVLAIIAAIALVVAAIWWLVENWDSVVAWISDAWDAVTAWVVAAWDTATAWVVAAWEAAVQFVLDWIARVQENFDRVVGFIRSLWDSATGWVADRFRAAAQFVVDYIAQIRANFDRVVGFIRSLWSSVTGWVADQFRRYVTDPLIRAWETVKDGFRRVADWISDRIQSLIGGIQNMLGWISDAVNGFLNLIGLGNSAPAAPAQASIAPPALPDAPIWATMGLAYGVISAAMAAQRNAAAPQTRYLSGSDGQAPQVTNVNITVNGAVDPVATARQIKELLDKYEIVSGRA